MKLADAEMERRDEAEEEFVTHGVSNIHTAAERVRNKLAGLGLLGAAGAMGGLVVLLGAGFIVGLARKTQAHDCIDDCVKPFVAKAELGDFNDMATVLPNEKTFTGSTHAMSSMLLHAKLITKLEPDQKRAPCVHPERSWKGGCWLLYSLPGATTEEKVARCKTTDGYEPEPGWCEKTEGLVYVPVKLEDDKKKPPVSVEPGK